MLDDILEIMVDVGAELAETAVEHKVKRAKDKKSSAREKESHAKRKTSSGWKEDPWDRKPETPPWEK